MPYELTPEEEDWVRSSLPLYRKSPKTPTSCDCVGKSGVPKKSFASKRQVMQWARVTKRLNAKVYMCDGHRWHLSHK